MTLHDSAGEPAPPPPPGFGKLTKRTEAALLTRASAIGMHIQRLRTRVWTWNFIRLGVAACATWLGWRYTNAGAGPLSLALSLLLFAFSLLLRSNPEIPN
jgi:hypothetical protein